MSAPLAVAQPLRDVVRAGVEGVCTALIGLDLGRRTRRTEAGVAVGAVVLAALAAGIAVGVGHDAGRLLLLLAGVVLPIVAVVVRRPLLGWRVCWLAGLLAPFVPGESRLDLVQVTIEAALFCVAAVRYGRPVSWAMWLLDLIAIWVWADSDWRSRLIASVGLTLLAVAVDALAGWWRTRGDLAAQTQLTRAEVARRAVLEERARIAREMHDVVAHHLSLIAVQTATAPYRLGGLDDDVGAEFESLNASAREALADTRALLDTLRADDDTTDSDAGADRAPQPTLADIAELVSAARRAGVPAELTTTGDTSGVRVPIAVSAYRIVQEALSNAARHAPGATVAVCVEQRADRLLVRVRNAAGDAGGIADVAGGGHGLTGMRERVAVLDGRLHAGATADGGFEVLAELPITREATS